MPETTLLFGHLFQSHGRRHGYGALADRPGIAQQQATINEWVRRKEQDGSVSFEVRWAFDYAREVQGLQSLPNLRTLLEWSKTNEFPCLVAFTDLSRVFSRTTINQAEILLNELNSYSSNLLDLRHKVLLSQKNRLYLTSLVLSGKTEKREDLANASRLRRPHSHHIKSDLRRAARRSAAARGAIADEAARQIEAVANGLRSGEAASSWEAIARAANEKGLRTTRGNLWTGKAVSRAMERLKAQ